MKRAFLEHGCRGPRLGHIRMCKADWDVNLKTSKTYSNTERATCILLWVLKP